MSDAGPTPRQRAQTGAALLVIACVCFKAVISVDLFPGWDTDPTMIPTAIVGLTPTGLLVTDALTALGAVVVMTLRDRRVEGAWDWLLTALVLCGAAPAFLHAGFGDAVDLDGLALASSWSAAMAGAVALRTAARDATTRRVCLACLLGLVLMLAAKGVVQVAVEHPATVAMFRRTKDEYLRAQGWTPDSMMAKAYERRLTQAEATGWFGLANVYSTLMAGCIAAFGGLLVAAMLRRRPRSDDGACGVAPGWVLVVALALLSALVGLVLAGSKGGYAAATLGLGVICVLGILRKWQNTQPGTRRSSVLAWMLGLGVIAAPLSAVIVRGQLGERIGELSLLFRWFYMQAAARIIAVHPFGVGPGGFKDAYLLAKNPLSPEDVSSPHSVLFDWAATLGWAGLAWCALLAAMIVGAMRGALTPGDGPQPPRNAAALRRQERPAFLTLAAATIAAAFLERRLASPESSVVRVIGLAGGVVVACAVIRVMSARAAWTSVALAGAAAAIAAHLQIEMAGTQVGACGWVFAILGLVSAKDVPEPSSRTPHRPGMLRLAAPAAFVGVLAGILAPLWRVAAWERSLAHGLRVIAPLPEFDARRTALKTGKRVEGDSVRQLFGDVQNAFSPYESPKLEEERRAFYDSRQHPGATGQSWEEVDWYFLKLARATMREASEALASARATLPRHFGTLRAWARLDTEIALLDRSLGDSQAADARLRSIENSADAFGHSTWGNHAGVQAWLATVHRTMADWTHEPRHLELAAHALETATRLGPYDLQYATDLALVSDSLGRRVAAKAWASKALELNRQRRLDPLTQLDDTKRRALERLAAP